MVPNISPKRRQYFAILMIHNQFLVKARDGLGIAELKENDLIILLSLECSFGNLAKDTGIELPVVTAKLVDDLGCEGVDFVFVFLV